MNFIKIPFFIGSVALIIISTISYITLDHYYLHHIIPRDNVPFIDFIPSIESPSYLTLTFNQNITEIHTIHDLQQKWRLLFFYIFIKDEWMNALRTNPLYASSIRTLLAKHPQFNNKSYAAQCYNKLLQLTIHHLAPSLSSFHVLHKQHHNILSLRRYIMILQHKIPTVDHKLYKDTMRIFAQYSQHTNNTKIFYNIHISKSAGTTICDTAVKNAGKTSTLQNCNLPQMGVPIKNPYGAAKSCEEIDEMVHRHKKLQFIAQEYPMSGHKVSDRATLCDNYRYILSIRKPLTRIASTLTSWNSIHYFPFQILISYKHHLSFGATERDYCNQSFIKIHNEIYGPPETPLDFADFISHLFENEHQNTEIVESVQHNNFDCRSTSALGGYPYKNGVDDEDYTSYDKKIAASLYKKEDLTYIEWLGNQQKYAIKTTEGFKNRVNKQLIRSFCSNVITRFIGFEHENVDNVYDALFAKSHKINVKHWLNAIDFMMKTDYILPFDSKLDHQIWEYLLVDLFRNNKHKNSTQRRLYGKQSDIFSRVKTSIGKIDDKLVMIRPEIHKYDGLQWKRSMGKSSALGGKIETLHVLNTWTQKEKQFINNKNVFDNALYELATWIANVDVAFYEYLNSFV